MDTASNSSHHAAALATQQRPCRLLLADDQPHILDALELLLEPEGYILERAGTPALLMSALSSEDFDGILMDLNYTRDTTSGEEGLALIERIRGHHAHLPIIVMTAWGNIDLAVKAMHSGASDFIQKPWDNTRLLTVLRTQLELYRMQRSAALLEAENKMLHAEGAPVMIATAPSMQRVVELISRVGPSDANVLITGEHGSGKEVVAQALHRISLRSQRTMVAVNTGALSEGTFESELFGHVKGAFTDARSERVGRFELAHSSTLFLDEIANVPLRQQAKLLRVLETGEFERLGSSRTQKADVRVLSATNADLRSAAAAGTFRPDLLFRLNTVEIALPPLRERREDIPLLAAHFLSRYAAQYRRPVHGFEPAALERMLHYAWPGNVRELDHTLERAVLMARSEYISLSDLALQTDGPATPNSLDEMDLEAVEAHLVRKALNRYQGNVSAAAEALGLSRGALYRRMEKYGL
ncbi:sigma-54-dependent transcriptional regulator [Terriglobus roseus]|uniref:DNA-binding transcriptional response regulator, NtrC family, contains REC, AAA-type ATPase, and a Fis-type DNA-binding domains n=1 Tax=Terriglobus roseus TaxID=392734 RepID=A0A1G7MXB3_9BACT|nr:sigma-54 dependent transcriptional regulator [Terriglobus roseus]SDF66311.1 DNA-binding transcriptional response regulator, NtrC family, contains REC, AAA-type ATPase, and a Fis-type DNA-binding domains [Terriglobus roseus]